MEKEFVTRFVTATICIVLTIVIITTALIPIISDASTKTETAPAEGAYGFMKYQPSPETQSGSIPYRYFFASATSTNMVIKIGPANGLVTVLDVPISDFLNVDQIYYADSNIVLYVSDGAFYADYNNTTTQIRVSSNGDGVTLATTSADVYRCVLAGTTYEGGSYMFSNTPLPQYYYVVDPNGDYANFAGDNLPTMDTPSVSVAGMYIGPKIIEKTIESPYAAVYLVIPLIVLVSLLMMCVREFMRTRE